MKTDDIPRKEIRQGIVIKPCPVVIPHTKKGLGDFSYFPILLRHIDDKRFPLALLLLFFRWISTEHAGTGGSKRQHRKT
jgi:hypothetical protein